MKPSRIIMWSAITTIVGTVVIGKSKFKVPGFSK